MKEYPFEISVFPDNSPKEFKLACRKIEQEYPDLQKEKLLVDVDGSTIQIYNRGKEKILVYDDYDVGAVFILSDIDLRDVFV